MLITLESMKRTEVVNMKMKVKSSLYYYFLFLLRLLAKLEFYQIERDACYYSHLSFYNCL
ncbi:hypothetical protein BU24DRAFT_221111 [Aaosphaeria arxii CBS 175.79]|uniref:Uncharacterized protein n=1 Tax=Aaosphaeria arxii CBS 175.79 TaxID=1450172 RepID=A0A6A5XPK4_9PLEO|nr:uncharacterized protein BU24DRAFT_221111 [Aaosphaeria arxii CBS 175.79]KAF2014767.1 hypothetical protein BU24DRAFT_221111 [Aaosphaeria arxii CBS 175.79]